MVQGRMFVKNVKHLRVFVVRVDFCYYIGVGLQKAS